MKTRLLFAAAGLIAVSLPAQGRVQRPMTFEDFAAVRNVGDPQISPNGEWVLYSVRTTDVNANKRTTVTVLAPVRGVTIKESGAGSAGSRSGQFPNGGTQAGEARWSPDGKRVAYISGGQLWIVDANGANARQISSVNAGASGPVWSPTGDRIAFVSGVYPDCDGDACNIERAKAADTGKVKAHIADNLLYRHWTEWTPETRSHLFVVSPDGTGLLDVTSRVKYDVPPGPFGGSEGYSFSPDGKELAYTAKDRGREDAWSTDLNVYVVPVTGGPATVITASNRGADQNPVYSPDGRTILYASQVRPGFESDRVRLMAYDRASRTSRELLPKWDRNADSYAFSSSGDAIYLSTVDASRTKFYRISRGASGWSGIPQLLTSGGNNFSPSISATGQSIAWLQDATERPAEVYVGGLSARGLTDVRRLTHENDPLVAQLKLNPAEDFWFKGADGDSVQGLLIRPPQYQQGKKFPVLFLIHGGPQGEWLDQWHGRWNFELFASPGFGIVAINPRGSFGYGQKFTDQISKDWGGKAYIDLMNGLDAALARNSWLDSTRMGAAGGSYGGYMVLAGLAFHPEHWAAGIDIVGMSSLVTFLENTSEWRRYYREREYGYLDRDREFLEQASPMTHVDRMRAPLFIIHGANDPRVPLGEAEQIHRVLTEKGIPCELAVYHDEGHGLAKLPNRLDAYPRAAAFLDRVLSRTRA